MYVRKVNRALVGWRAQGAVSARLQKPRAIRALPQRHCIRLRAGGLAGRRQVHAVPQLREAGPPHYPCGQANCHSSMSEFLFSDAPFSCKTGASISLCNMRTTGPKSCRERNSSVWTHVDSQEQSSGEIVCYDGWVDAPQHRRKIK